MNYKDPELGRQLEHQNKGNGLQIMEMKSLRRKLKDNTHHFHLIMFLIKADMANQYIKHGIYINQQQFPMKKYTPHFQLVQRYKCQQFGHHAMTYRSLHDIYTKYSDNKNELENLQAEAPKLSTKPRSPRNTHSRNSGQTGEQHKHSHTAS